MRDATAGEESGNETPAGEWKSAMTRLNMGATVREIEDSKLKLAGVLAARKAGVEIMTKTRTYGPTVKWSKTEGTPRTSEDAANLMNRRAGHMMGNARS